MSHFKTALARSDAKHSINCVICFIEGALIIIIMQWCEEVCQALLPLLAHNHHGSDHHGVCGGSILC
jgi:hypothetical protein